MKFRGHLVKINWSVREHKSIAVASTFIVGTHGQVLLSHTVADYQTRPGIEQLLTMIEQTL